MPIVFPGFRTKALTFSYDDGTLQDRRLAALFRKYGLKATFNLNSGAFDEVQHGSHGGFSVNFSRVHAGEVRDLYASFEVASHTLTHPCLLYTSRGGNRPLLAKGKGACSPGRPHGFVPAGRVPAIHL